MHRRSLLAWTGAGTAAGALATSWARGAGAGRGALDLVLRSRSPLPHDPARHGLVFTPERWDPKQTAVIVVDMWDAHHSVNAARRVGELAPHLNRVVESLRARGATVIHAPSGCLEPYRDHPARKRALAVRPAAKLPPEIDKWCHKIPSEEGGPYPLDQSDDANEESAEERAQWHARLAAVGRDPKRPWQRQHAAIPIRDTDLVTDRGPEVWSILEGRRIDRVFLVGVHTNMCVLGRPFGLRQLAKNGKRPVLVRDLTDTMYNPAKAPFVSHFTGTDLIVEHIEKFVAPTVTSDQILGGGRPFRFAGDRRPHVAFLIDEDEYRTETTLPAFAREQLGRDFRTTMVFGHGPKAHTLPGMERLEEADLVVVSVRRRCPLPEQLQALRRHVEAGKPVVGIRTASHAFWIKTDPPAGRDSWRSFDPDVLGGNYQNHHPEGPTTAITVPAAAAKHPILDGVERAALIGRGSLYRTSPLAPGAEPLLVGTIPDKPAEPVAWTFVRADAGRSFYTSLGHPEDFKNRAFVRLLRNAIAWAAGVAG